MQKVDAKLTPALSSTCNLFSKSSYHNQVADDTIKDTTDLLLRNAWVTQTVEPL